jgi:leader peptidase (prepilin peptidase)/N-methyltransferase
MLVRDARAEARATLEDADGAAADALPAPYNLVRPRSHCPACGHAVRATENVPVVSYLLLRGRCAACGTRIPARYPLLELATGALALLVVLRFGITQEAAFAFFFASVLVALAVIDLDTFYLPDVLTYPLLWAGLAANALGTFVPLADAVWGAIAGYLLLWSVYWAFKLLTGKEGMGYGDFKLLAALAAWFGWQALPSLVIVSSLTGAIVGIALIVSGRQDRSRPIPFGPFLAAAGLVVLFTGDVLALVAGALGT